MKISFIAKIHFGILSVLFLCSRMQAQELPGPTSTGQSPVNPPTAPNQIPNTGEAASPGTPAPTPSASTTGEQTMAPIVVTGSLIPTTDAEGAEPVIVVDSETIQKRAYQTATDILAHIPSNGSFSNPGTTSGNFAAGAAYASLRGLGPQATLVLVNGRRVSDYAAAANGQYPFVDLNSIPAQIIDRVEVLTEGSELYGSDAVAGVVNIITKDSIGDDNAQVDLYFGDTGSEDAFEQRYSVIGSLSSFDKNGTGIVSVDYEHQNAIFAQDREVSESANQSHNGGFDLRSGRTFPGQFINEGTDEFFSILPGTGNVPLTGTNSATDPNVDNNANALQPYDYNKDTSIMPEYDRYGVYANYAYNFYGGNVRPSIDFTYRHNHTDLQQAPGGTVVGDNGPTNIAGGISDVAGSPAFTVPTNNPYNATGQIIDIYAYRFTDLGPRIEKVDQDIFRTVPQVDIKISDDWNLNVGFNYNYTFVDDRNVNFPSATAFQNALNGTTFGTAYNPFTSEQGANSPAVINSLYATSYNRDTTSLIAGDFHFTGKLFDLPAGPVSVATGGEERVETYTQDYGPEDQAGTIIGSTIQRNTDADREDLSAYAEVKIPITSKKFNCPGFYDFSIDVSGRVDKYSDIGTTENPQVAVRWETVPGVVIRGSFAKTFRAPSLPELFAGGNQAVEEVTDPVGGIRDVTINGGGNPLLKPETAEVFTGGVAYSPKAIKNLLLTADFFKITYSDQIQQQDAQTLIDEGSSQVEHNPDGTISSITATYSNLSSTVVEGIDFGVGYAIGDSQGTWGQLSFQLNSTDMLDYITDDGTGAQNIVGQDSGGLGGYSRYRQDVSLTYDYRAFEFNVSDDFTSGYDDSTVVADGINRKVHDYNTTDVQASYTFDKDVEKIAPTGRGAPFDWRQLVSGTRFAFGINNVADVAPPFAANISEPLGYDPAYADPTGRFFYGEITRRF